MRLAGNLKTTPIGDVLRPIALAGSTGVLHLERSPVLKKIIFRDGHIFSSWSNDPRESLAKFLVRDGVVTEEQLFHAMLRQGEEGRLVGSILVSVGLMTEEHLQTVLRTKVEETIYELFLWPEGRFEFKEGEFPSDVHIHVEMEVGDVLLEGARRIHEWVRVQKFFPALLRTTFQVLEEAGRDAAERRALSLAAAGKSLAEISIEVHWTEFETATRFVDLLAREVVSVGPPAAERTGAIALKDVPELLGRGYQKLQGGDHEEAVRIYERILSLDRLNFHAKKGIQSALEASRQERLRQANPNAPVPDLSPNEATLIVTGGPWHGTIHTMHAPPSQTLLGSGADCHLRLDLPHVERYHARIAGYSRGFILSDAGSANGTFANGRRVEASHTLADGDEICLGPPDSPSSARILLRLPTRYRGAAGPARPETAPRANGGTPPAPPAASPAWSAGSSGLVGRAVAPTPLSAPHSFAPPPARASSPIAPPSPARSDSAHPAPRAEAPRPRASSSGGAGRYVAIAAMLLLVSGGAFAAYRGLLKSGPDLRSLDPTRARPGDRVTLRGTGFEREAARNHVLFGDQTAQVDSATDRQLTVVVPASLQASDGSLLAVTVNSPRGSSGPLSFTLSRAPKAEALEPDVALPGDVVEVRGRDLDRLPATVTVGDALARVESVAPGSLRVVVPEIAVHRDQSVPVRVKFGSDPPQELSLVLGRLPLITGVSPARGPVGERVTIRGKGFDGNPLGNLVTFNGQPALVLSAEPTALAVAAPGVAVGASAVDAQVVVQVMGRSPSLPATYTLTRAAGEAFTLRFFPEPETEHPTHDHALVSTELGPVLLLTGHGSAPTTAERAYRIATALNALNEAAGGETAEVKLADKPTPGAVEGPTPEDADGYGESWGPAARERRPSVGDVAAYWQALLQDYRALFLRGAKPDRMLDLSPRGDVLSEIHARIPRASDGSASAGPRTLGPLPPAVARRIRDLALLVPAGAATRGPAGAVGSWEGTMTETGTGVQALRLRLNLDGSKLLGSATVRASGGTSEFPLDDVRYERGTLRFGLGGGPPGLEFSGALRGESMTGTIRGNPPRNGVVGRFALRLVDGSTGAR